MKLDFFLLVVNLRSCKPAYTYKGTTNTYPFYKNQHKRKGHSFGKYPKGRGVSECYPCKRLTAVIAIVRIVLQIESLSLFAKSTFLLSDNDLRTLPRKHKLKIRLNVFFLY